MARLISCLPDSNRNSAGEFVKVSKNWLNGELTCSTQPWAIDRYLPSQHLAKPWKMGSSFNFPPPLSISFPFFFFFPKLFMHFLVLLVILFSVHLCSFQAVQTRFEHSTGSRPQFHSVLEDFCPLRWSHRVLRCVPSYTSYQDPAGALTAESPRISYFDVRLPGFLSRGLMVDEAWQLGPWRVREVSPELISDGLVDTVIPTEHIPIEDLVNPKPIGDKFKDAIWALSTGS